MQFSSGGAGILIHDKVALYPLVCDFSFSGTFLFLFPFFRSLPCLCKHTAICLACKALAKSVSRMLTESKVSHQNNLPSSVEITEPKGRGSEGKCRVSVGVVCFAFQL
jgi:hypothetical protein